MSPKILYSQIGYDIGTRKKAFVTGKIKNGSFIVTTTVTKQKVLEDKLTFWGEKWNALLTAKAEVVYDKFYTLNNEQVDGFTVSSVSVSVSPSVSVSVRRSLISAIHAFA